MASPLKPDRTAITHNAGSPVITSAASTPCVTTRARSAATITVWREMRSATTPPINSELTSGSVRQASTIPTSVADPPSSSTANARAMFTIRSPSTETANAPKTSRKSRWRSTARLPGSPRTGGAAYLD